ncbi:CRISPR-associated protein Cas2 [Fontimonas thermophila]|uniref:CRISPR-associated endoribonuclease Cas2 n=1 Tax=Fontimonas thermophila TaxID=1076937 RepID=A0A1I2J098_9GAMM|nr:CRISPR-associated endonuclease Cas2 [Fontimonas thermophila]SFF47428.1 CRISPR-associated protein Cas2 [Fontimonas thermophila]
MISRQLFLVAYDVRDPERLHRVLQCVGAYSLGGQKSVHECPLSQAERKALIADSTVLLDPAEDRMLLMHLDPRARVFTLGRAQPPQTGQFFYFG